MALLRVLAARLSVPQARLIEESTFRHIPAGARPAAGQADAGEYKRGKLGESQHLSLPNRAQ